MLKIPFFLCILLILINYSNSVEITSAVVLKSEFQTLFSEITEEFNEYSKIKKLGIELKLDIYTEGNNFNSNSNETELDYHLKTNSKKYDLYFYDISDSRKYSSNLLNLKDALPRNHLYMYSNGAIASQVCKFNGEWVGLPIYINFNALYFNKKLFNDYGLSYPETWDEFLEKGKIIYNGEKSKGNTNLIGFNGLVPDGELCICTVQGIIHSFREKRESHFPDYKSKEAINALKTLKEIKEELSSDKIFQADENLTMEYLKNGNALYLLYWYIEDDDVYKRSDLVGDKYNISGTVIGGYNIGINKYLKPTKKRYALEVLKFFTSFEYQKNITMYKGFLSGINSLYEDKEVCNYVDCELMNNMQPISRAPRLTDEYKMDYDEYSNKFKELIFKFLYGDEKPETVLNEIDDLTKIYTITVDSEDSKIGLIMLIVVLVIAVIMAVSTFLIIAPNSEYAYSFLTGDFWILTIIGCILYLSYIIMNYGEVTNLKCHMKVFLHTFAFTCSFIPSFHVLVSNYPKKNHFSSWIRKNRYIFLLFFLVIDVVLNELVALSTYNAEIKIIDEGKNFKYCKHSTIGTYLKLNLIILIKSLFIIGMLFLIFIEWNLKRSYKDVRLIVSGLVSYLILYLIFLIYNILDTKINNYVVRFTIQSVIIIAIVISNYITLFGYRILYLFKKELSTSGLSIRTKRNSLTSNKSSVSTVSKQDISLLSFHERIYFYHQNPYIIGNSNKHGSRSVSKRSSMMASVSRKNSNGNTTRSAMTNPTESIHTFSFD